MISRATSEVMVNQPILVLRAGDGPAAGLCAEILRCEGFPWLEEQPVDAFDTMPPGAATLIVAGSGVGRATAERLARAVADGTTLIATAPDTLPAGAFGVDVGGARTDALLSVTDLAYWEHGAMPLLCPDDAARPLDGGREAAALRDASGRRLGAGLVEVPHGAGRAWLFGYDLCRTIAALRHGTGSLDERPQRDMGPLYGPRHIYSFFALSNKLPRDVPVADLHQDVLRTLVAGALAATGLPRLWHFPEAAPSLWFVKGDGCGETGADFEVEFVERYGAYLTFYWPPRSRYGGELLRAWHERGHGIGIEADITGVTQVQERVGDALVRRGRSVAELNERWLPAIRANLTEHRDAFERETGFEADTVCIHGCQWTGLTMAQMILELGWHTPTHFISHDPRMRRHERYGPYMIASGLPLRYFEPGVGLLDLWHMPAQWDESETIGRHEDLIKGPFAGQPERAEGMVGLTAEEYGIELARFAQDAASRWHVVQIANFHPCYVADPQDHPRASRRALQLGLEGARATGCRFSNLENWSRFFRARAAVRLADWRREDGATHMVLASADGVQGLTLALPDGAAELQDTRTGERYPVQVRRLEGRPQRVVVLALSAGEPLALRLKHRS